MLWYSFEAPQQNVLVFYLFLNENIHCGTHWHKTPNINQMVLVFNINII